MVFHVIVAIQNAGHFVVEIHTYELRSTTRIKPVGAAKLLALEISRNQVNNGSVCEFSEKEECFSGKS